MNEPTQYPIKTKEPIGIKCWSISRLKIKCDYRLKLQFLDRPSDAPQNGSEAVDRTRVPMPSPVVDRPAQTATEPLRSSTAPTVRKEKANDRGTRVHKAAEDYISHARDDRVPELDHFAAQLAVCRQAYSTGRVVCEEQIGFDRDWNEFDPRDSDCWLRIGPDLVVYGLDDERALLVDYKTGRKDGNEVDHIDQITLGSVGLFRKAPQLKTVIGEVWYFDTGQVLRRTFTRAQAERFMRTYDRRGREFTDPRTTWKPKPSMMNCRFCPYKTGKIGGPKAKAPYRIGSGHCPHNGDEY